MKTSPERAWDSASRNAVLSERTPEAASEKTRSQPALFESVDLEVEFLIRGGHPRVT